MIRALFGVLGRVEYDPVADALLCHVCGRWRRGLSRHLRRVHHLDANAYRVLAGLGDRVRLTVPRPRTVSAECAREKGRWDVDRARFRARASDRAPSSDSVSRERGFGLAELSPLVPGWEDWFDRDRGVEPDDESPSGARVECELRPRRRSGPRLV